MILLKEIVRKQGINFAGKAINREAVRGIIIDDKKLLMIYSAKDGDYKFPGGGVEPGETYKETLIREVKEEIGATITKIEKEFGKVLEYDKPIEKEYDVFKMTSYYFICKVDAYLGEQSLDEYEKDLGFEPVWVNIDDAINVNNAIINSCDMEIPRWTPRETYVLQLIKEELFKY